MAKPLRSSDPRPQDLQFTHFGVLDAGAQSKGSLATSVGVNVVLLIIAVILGAAAKKITEQKRLENVTFVATHPPAPPPAPKPLPKPLPKPMLPKPVVEPRVVLPKPVIEPPKPVPVTMPKPMPVVTPAPPKAVVAAAAPKPVDVHLGASATVANHDLHPAAVSLGQANNPIAPTNRPSTAAVNLGNAGLSGMPPGTGRGANATAVSLGSGQPNGSLNGGGARAVAGVKLGGVTNGTPGGTGNGVGVRAQQVALGRPPEPPAATRTSLASMPVHQGPQVVYKPRPVYTAEATAKRIEGTVSVKIHVASSGAVTVLGVTGGLGYGLDQSAMNAAQGTRFKPAVDANGNAVDWEGVVRITFQLAS